MKHWNAICLSAVVCLWVAAGCNPGGEESEQDRDGASGSVTNVRSQEGVVVLDQAVQHQMGLKTAEMERASLPREVKAYGQVVEPRPLIVLVAELTSARTELGVSKRQWQRIRTLYEQHQNTSLRALETAEAAMKQSQVAVEAARLKLVADWGNSMAGQRDLMGFVKSLTTSHAALVRIHLPAGEHLDSPPRSASITTLGQESKPVVGEWVGPAPQVEPKVQGQGFFFLVESNSMSLMPGAAVTAKLELGGPPLVGVVVPESAVVRHEKQAWVYLQTDDTTFTRRQVDLNHPLENGWLVTNTLKQRDRIVVGGAQLLLSEESKSKIQLGD